jgi:hypothetical protein
MTAIKNAQDRNLHHHITRSAQQSEHYCKYLHTKAERYQLLLLLQPSSTSITLLSYLWTMSNYQDMSSYVINTQEVPIVDDTDLPTQYDAFLYYSDDEVRMRTLSGGILGSARESTGANGALAIRRKTRLSFELHPSVFFDDLFADDDVAENINPGDLINYLKGKNPQLAALVATFHGVDLDANANIRTPRAA